MIASTLLLTTPLLPTAEAQHGSANYSFPNTGYAGGSPNQGPTSGVTGPLASGVTPSITVSPAAFLSFSPNPVGVNQMMLVNMWTTPPVSPERFESGYVVTIIKPDGTKETIGPLTSYPADATAWFNYIPSETGTYQFQFTYGGEYFPAGLWLNGQLTTNTSAGAYSLSDGYYQPASTEWQNLTVQTNMVQSWPPAALPGTNGVSSYWTRPVYPENREWWSILGSYPPYGIVGGGPDWPANTNTYMSNYNYVPYTYGPTSCHIEYMQAEADAGVIGGTAGAYPITPLVPTPSVIYNGRCYETTTVPINGVPTSCAVCFDLQTGYQYYAIPIASGGVTPNVISYTPPGASSQGVAGEVGAEASGSYTVTLIDLTSPAPGQLYSQMYKINPWTGAITLNVTAMGPQLLGGIQGSVAQTGFFQDPYVLSIQTVGTGITAQNFLINWTTAGSSANFATRIADNVSIPVYVPSFPAGILGYSTFAPDFQTNMIFWMAGIAPLGLGVYHGTWIKGISMSTGQLLWNMTYPTMTRYSTACFGADHGTVICLMEGGYYAGFSETTGQVLWTSQVMDYPWSSDGFGGYSFISAYGLFYRCAYDGVYAFNWTNGDIVWHYFDPAVPFETPYTNINGTQGYSFNGGGFIANGVFYTYDTEHTPTMPVTRGWGIQAINATTGAFIWKIYGSSEAPAAVSDGYLVAGNSADGKLYVYGAGQSSTTLSAPLTTTPQGQGIMLTGAVLDKSPAQPGTPCVADSSMATWMEYLHMQQPIDGLFHNVTITGVPVSIDAVAPEGSSIHIATVTTDGPTGTFGYTWAPTTPGQYKVTATFAGDDSYGNSYATTYVSVGQTTATPTPAPATATPSPVGLATANDIMTYIIVAAIAIIIAIAIVGVLILRKRP